jgi:GMP synthase (glutamine-hydrolysing)
MHEAIGDRYVTGCNAPPPTISQGTHVLIPFFLSFSFHAIMVDNGVLRSNEAEQVHEMLKTNLGVNLTIVDASDLFLSRLEGVEDPERKRKIIGNTFINVFEEQATQIEAAAESEDREGGDEKGLVEWLLQGTLYPDVIESISFKGPSATIKTHHNVGGLLKDMKLKLIEPLRELFKGEFPSNTKHP